MAQDCTLESVRLFMLEKGGKCSNHDIVAKFKRFLNDPVKKLENRNKLKDFVHLLASVETVNGEKLLVLKKRYHEQGCSNLFSNQEVSEAHLYVAEPSPITVPQAFNSTSTESKSSAGHNSVLHEASLYSNNSVFGFYSSGNFSAPQFMSSPSGNGRYERSSYTCPTIPEDPIEPVRNEADMPIETASIHSSSRRSSATVVPDLQNELGFYSSMASRLSASVLAENALDASPISNSHLEETSAFKKESSGNQQNIEPEDKTVTGADDKAITGTGDKVVTGADDKGITGEESTPVQNEAEKEQGTPEKNAYVNSLTKKTPISAKDRIKQFDQIVSENEAVRVPARSKYRESRLLNSAHSEAGNEDQDILVFQPLEPVEKQWMIASSGADYNIMHKLLLEHPDLAHRRDFINGNAMHWAAKHGKPNVVKLLTAYQVDANVKSDCGYTPLHLAAMNGNEEVIDLLVNHCKAKPNTRDFYGKRPKQYLKRTCSTRIQQMLLGAARSMPTHGFTGNLGHAEESNSFSRTQSFSAKVKKTTQKVARRFSNRLNQSNDNFVDNTDSGSIRSITPDASPNSMRKGNMPESRILSSSRHSSASYAPDTELMPPPSGFIGRGHGRKNQLSSEDGFMHRSESAPDFTTN